MKLTTYIYIAAAGGLLCAGAYGTFPFLPNAHSYIEMSAVNMEIAVCNNNNNFQMAAKSITRNGQRPRLNIMEWRLLANNWLDIYPMPFIHQYDAHIYDGKDITKMLI